MTKETILVFGGNGFIGAETVELLLNTYGDKYELVLVNRDNWDDWDAEIRIRNRIKINIFCDRKRDSLDCALKDYLCQKDFKFYAILDFSGLKQHFIREVIKHIPPEKINLYIYISTDSVYEVSEINVRDREGYLLKETDSVRPSSKEEIEKLKEFDSYAHEKLECEEVLIKNAKFPYAILRLPDVIGPRDSTNRFWFYQMWLQYIEASNRVDLLTIPIPSFFYKMKTSYVYVTDIARLVLHLLESNVRNEVFNIGFDEHVTLIEFIKLIAHAIKPGFEQDLNFKEEKKCYFKHEFPSVTKAPVDTSKCKYMLNFQFTGINKAIQETVDFYNLAYKKFPSERRLIVKDISKEIFKTEDERDVFKDFIRNFNPIKSQS